MTMNKICAANLDEVKDIVEYAKANTQRLEVVAGGTKQGLGRAADHDAILDVSKMAGIIDYQPEELIMTLRAGTAMVEVEKALSDAHQMLAFEAPDHSMMMAGAADHAGTIGGIMATNLSGSRRLTAGAARDFLLGFEAISGRGENFKSGGKVVKNVTGYDLSKLMCGSYGTLAVMDEITIKTLPRPETSCSLICAVADYAAGVAQIARIFATPHEPGAAAILPKRAASKAKLDVNAEFVIAIRLEGIAVSVQDRLTHLQTLFGGDALAHADSTALWRQITSAQLVADDRRNVWKISCAPTDAAGVLAAVSDKHDVDYFADWAGGLIWVSGPGYLLGQDLRAAVNKLDSGFVQLFRDVGATKDKIEPFHPLSSPLLGLHKRVKAAFDPLGVLNAGRMHDGV